ncbi:MAG: double-strand break repair protein AddB, partial [Rhodospirillales bacterium]
MKSSVLKGVYTIAAGNGFLNDLAHGLKTAFADEKLAQTRIYLPTRRACRDLTEAFLRLPDSTGLLPRAYPLGDVDEDELTFSALEPALTAAEAVAGLPPAISPVERSFFLAKLIQAKHASENKSELPLAGALRLADALGKFLDDLAIEQTDAATIRTLQSDQFAEHWQKVMKFLEIVIDAWPAYLEENGRIDSAARRVKLLEAQATMWRELPPSGPVLIAGSTGSLKSTRALMKSLLAAQEGIIVLPGFEQETDPDEIAAILTSPTHPQHVMMKTLEELQLSTSDVQIWPTIDREQTRYRRRFIQEAMRPAEKVSEWRNLKSDELVRGIQGVRRIDAPNEETEARVIALWLREQAENGPAALATSDRKLARRVASELKRWNIEADDSAGQPLIETPAGTFLRLIALATAPEAGVLDLLALLKHPLTAGGMSRGRFRRRARALEIKVWRNDRHQRQARDLETTVSLLREEGESLLANFAEHVLTA